MVILKIISFVLGATPLIRRLWCWIWERNMGLELREPHSEIVRGRSGLNIPDGTGPIFTVNVGEKPYIYMWCDLVITNHSGSKPEVITNCELHLKIRHWLLWGRTIASAPVLVEPNSRNPKRDQTAWKPVKLEPVSLPMIVSVEAQGDIDYPIEKLPRRMRLVLEFDRVGPHKRIRKTVHNIMHSYNAVSNPDKGDYQT